MHASSEFENHILLYKHIVYACMSSYLHILIMIPQWSYLLVFKIIVPFKTKQAHHISFYAQSKTPSQCSCSNFAPNAQQKMGMTLPESVSEALSIRHTQVRYVFSNNFLPCSEGLFEIRHRKLHCLDKSIPSSVQTLKGFSKQHQMGQYLLTSLTSQSYGQPKPPSMATCSKCSNLEACLHNQRKMLAKTIHSSSLFLLHCHWLSDNHFPFRTEMKPVTPWDSPITSSMHTVSQENNQTFLRHHGHFHVAA